MHHQAIKRLGDGLREVAWAPDGIIEGVEMPGDDRFVVGVQWHPEELVAIRPRGISSWRSSRPRAAAPAAEGRARVEPRASRDQAATPAPGACRGQLHGHREHLRRAPQPRHEGRPQARSPHRCHSRAHPQRHHRDARGLRHPHPCRARRRAGALPRHAARQGTRLWLADRSRQCGGARHSPPSPPGRRRLRAAGVRVLLLRGDLGHSLRPSDQPDHRRADAAQLGAGSLSPATTGGAILPLRRHRRLHRAGRACRARGGPPLPQSCVRARIRSGRRSPRRDLPIRRRRDGHHVVDRRGSAPRRARSIASSRSRPRWMPPPSTSCGISGWRRTFAVPSTWDTSSWGRSALRSGTSCSMAMS